MKTEKELWKITMRTRYYSTTIIRKQTENEKTYFFPLNMKAYE